MKESSIIPQKKIIKMPVTNAKDVGNNTVASTTFNKRFQSCCCDAKWSIFIRMILLQIVYKTPMF